MTIVFSSLAEKLKDAVMDRFTVMLWSQAAAIVIGMNLWILWLLYHFLVKKATVHTSRDAMANAVFPRLLMSRRRLEQTARTDPELSAVLRQYDADLVRWEEHVGIREKQVVPPAKGRFERLARRIKARLQGTPTRPTLHAAFEGPKGSFAYSQRFILTMSLSVVFLTMGLIIALYLITLARFYVGIVEDTAIVTRTSLVQSYRAGPLGTAQRCGKRSTG